MDKIKFYELIDRYLDGNASEQEKKLLEEYYNRLEKMGTSNLSAEEKATLKEDMYGNIMQGIRPKAKIILIRKKLFTRVAAAILIIVLAGAAWLVFNNKEKDRNSVAAIPQQQFKTDVEPGGFKAKLILSDGSTVILDNAPPGQLAEQGNTVIVNKAGQLVYKSEKGSESIVYNTVSTNKGETYSFTLADGSKVWLNSGSSIHFPVTFPGRERRIEVTGEVYVKVAHNPQQPFIASANGMEVLALGTEFNINSYSDEENITATLIEGRVEVSKGTTKTILNPGQQTQLLNNGELTAAKEVSIDEITGWKDGFFHFESADLKTILRQFARWYDIEVVYEGKITDRKFFGIVKRSNTLKKVLEMLQDNNIVYQIEGKKLIVKSS